MSESKKNAVVARDFRDSGTETEFKAGASVQLDPGTFENYLAAGLISEPGTDAAKTAKVDDGKGGKPA